MSRLRIQLEKRRDGAIIMRCIRRDGSVTWQRGNNATARFFALHDLTHFAVETTLGFRRGFYGLLAEGWDITDFGPPWPRGRIPSDAEPAEWIVGALDRERASRERVSADEIAQTLETERAKHHRLERFAPLDAPVTDAQLDAIRARLGELLAQWAALPTGEVMELEYS